MVIKSDESNKQPRLARVSSTKHLRSLSMDSDFFDKSESASGDNKRVNKKSNNERSVEHHWHNNSMDISSTTSFKVNSKIVTMDDLKKIMVSDKLSEISLLDRKKAKRRILAHRQSAGRSKRPIRILYAIKLERKMRRLRAKEAKLSAQLAKLEKKKKKAAKLSDMMEREYTNLNAEYEELKINLEAMERETQLTEAVKEALKEKLLRLRAQSGDLVIFLVNLLLASHSAMKRLTNSAPSGQNHPNFMDFNHKK